jgi:hypothetical protein
VRDWPIGEPLQTLFGDADVLLFMEPRDRRSARESRPGATDVLGLAGQLTLHDGLDQEENLGGSSVERWAAKRKIHDPARGDTSETNT